VQVAYADCSVEVDAGGVGQGSAFLELLRDAAATASKVDHARREPVRY
jgi:hypothetical protein